MKPPAPVTRTAINRKKNGGLHKLSTNFVKRVSLSLMKGPGFAFCFSLILRYECPVNKYFV